MGTECALVLSISSALSVCGNCVELQGTLMKGRLLFVKYTNVE